MFKYLLYKFGQFCVRRLPLNVAYRIAVFMSDLHYFLSFRDRLAVRNNLKVILDETEDINRSAREVFRNFGKYLVEFFRMAEFVDLSYIKKNIQIVNWETFKKLWNDERGLILITAHIGNWELGAVAMSLMGYKSMAIALPHKERPVNDLFNQQREGKGVAVVPTSVAVRQCLEVLNSGGMVSLIVDRDFNQKGEIMEFFGRKAIFPRGPIVFSQKTGANLLPVFLTRNSDNTFTMEFKDPIYSEQGQDNEQAPLDVMQRYVRVIEQEIRQHPTQWLMFRKFWVD